MLEQRTTQRFIYKNANDAETFWGFNPPSAGLGKEHVILHVIAAPFISA